MEEITIGAAESLLNRRLESAEKAFLLFDEYEGVTVNVLYKDGEEASERIETHQELRPYVNMKREKYKELNELVAAGRKFTADSLKVNTVGYKVLTLTQIVLSVFCFCLFVYIIFNWKDVCLFVISLLSSWK